MEYYNRWVSNIIIMEIIMAFICIYGFQLINDNPYNSIDD